ncbi:MAG: patatin-like phospholipase family protein [Bacteroidetes bacterium]|nr:patatin-like phospholipase family protein [Bacteroidota bacterium]
MRRKKPATKNSITVADYTQHPDVLQCIANLKNKFGDNFESLLVSDTLDDQGHQYVNLVQKGGGVLGVALVGYTYILEQAGIRFLRLAGTSAGAINTALITVIGKKEEEKSPRILEYLTNLNFFDLVDGKPHVRWLIKTFITHKNFKRQVQKWFTGILLILIGLTIADFIFLGLRNYYPWALVALRVSYILTAFHLVLIGFILYSANHLFKSLREGGHGLNPGKYFYDWIKNIMEENGVSTVSEFNRKAEHLPTLSVRNPTKQNAKSLFADVTLISSELTSQNKIEFPKMCELFCENQDDIHPASFVRASMSIPIFFRSYNIEKIPRKSAQLKNAWLKHFGTDKNIPRKARFVDGGLMSDFPINIFYNARIVEPRLPSFGIDLDDTAPDTAEDDDDDLIPNSLGEYLGGLFNTIRYYYDKDFLIKNNVFKKGIGKIELSEFNWLNFFVNDESKIKMFVKGAQSATEFLTHFNWADYQEGRIQMQLMFNEKNTNENETNRS